MARFREDDGSDELMKFIRPRKNERATQMKRRAFSKKSEEERERRRKLLKITLSGRGNVDGIEINLQHELLPMWWLPPEGFLRQTSRIPDAPFLWFPWSGEFNKRAAMQRARRAMAAHGLQPTDEKSFRRYLAAQMPDCYVCPGDQISVRKVEIWQIGDQLDHADDAEERRVFIQVIGADEKNEFCENQSHTTA